MFHHGDNYFPPKKHSAVLKCNHVRRATLLLALRSVIQYICLSSISKWCLRCLAWVWVRMLRGFSHSLLCLRRDLLLLTSSFHEGPRREKSTRWVQEVKWNLGRCLKVNSQSGNTLQMSAKYQQAKVKLGAWPPSCRSHCLSSVVAWSSCVTKLDPMGLEREWHV